MNLLITGATGLIGQELGLALWKAGHHLVGLTRDRKKALAQAPFPAQWIEGDISREVPQFHDQRFDGVIHLAGESIGAKSWSEEQKQKILESRTLGTRHLLSALKTQNPTFFIGASAIGIYPPSSGESWLTEATPPSDNFLSQVAQAWENETQTLSSNIRKVLFRQGVVLSTQGGALPKMILPGPFASSRLGSGQQWMSWVHINDVVRAFLFAVENQKVSGIYNLVAPEPCQQKKMAEEITQQLHRFLAPPVPAFALKLILGEQADLVLRSQRVSGQKLIDAGFTFEFPDIASALKNLLARNY